MTDTKPRTKTPTVDDLHEEPDKGFHGNEHGDIWVPGLYGPFPMPIPGTDAPNGYRKGPGHLEGAGVLKDSVELWQKVAEDGWVNGLNDQKYNIVNNAIDLYGDPIGSLASAGVGWVLEHIEPLPTYLDWFAGDPMTVEAFSQTWHNVGTEAGRLAADFQGHTAIDLAGLSSEAVGAYQDKAADRTKAIQAVGVAGATLGKLTLKIAVAISVVRSIVRDIIAAYCAIIAKIVLRQGLFAIPAVKRYVSQASTMVRKVINDLLPAITTARRFYGEIIDLLQGIPRIIGSNTIGGFGDYGEKHGERYGTEPSLPVPGFI